MKTIKKRILFPLFLSFLSFTFTGCYEDFINIYSEFTQGIYNHTETEIAFYHYLSAGSPPKGITRFPDGGSHDILFKKVTLYRYNLETEDLMDIVSFGDLPSNAGSWRNEISWQQSKIAYSLSPLGGWDWMIEHSTNRRYKPLKEKYCGIFIYDLENSRSSRVTDTGFEPALSPDEDHLAYLVADSIKKELWIMDLTTKEARRVAVVSETDDYPPDLYWADRNNLMIISGKEYALFNIESKSIIDSITGSVPDQRIVHQGEIIDITKAITFQEWGLSLSSVWPRKKKEYIRDIIRLNGNLNYRKAIIEMIGKELDVKEVEKMIDQMNKYQDKLESVEKMNYEIFSEETRELLRRLKEEKE